MKFTTVGTFDMKDLDLIKTVCAISFNTPYNHDRALELKNIYTCLDCNNISYKLVFNEQSRVKKIIFRKIKG